MLPHATAMLFVVALLILPPGAGAQTAPTQSAPSAPDTAASTLIKVFLDCARCFADFLRTEVALVDYVRDRTQANVHVLVTSAETGGGGREYTLAFIGLPPLFEGFDQTLRTITTTSDPEDTVRRQLATSLRVGLLRYITRTTVPPELTVTAGTGADGARTRPTADRWNAWVFSLRGSASFDGEESSRQRFLGLDIGASRITPNWKITFGVEADHETQEFDLDEEDPVKVQRRERDFEVLIVKAVTDHWSVGGEAEIQSSTFDNLQLALAVAPAVEFNVFPYSMYTRRQLRAKYALGLQRLRYYEQTLFGKTGETLPGHEISLTYEQRERWGSIEARTEWSQYLHDLARNRLESEGQVSIRVARGLSVGGALDASRIRDQLFLPLRGATEEEVLLRLRRLQSGYEYGFRVSLTYTFGSIFSSIVNPRFGR
ncbi:MAG: hypothetical protein M3545_00875 [Acidobacteriota bacterium]|nr:hypothetical protein [Acidobacteriota bacterium]